MKSAKLKNEARESSNTVLGCRVQSVVITLNLQPRHCLHYLDAVGELN
jgi:hypothetical protein